MKDHAPEQVFAFECRIVGTDWTHIINHRSAGKAKTEYWRGVQESCRNIPFTAVRARKVGAPHTSEAFINNARYRGLPNVRCGHRVKVGGALGVIVGHNMSANFNILFDDDAPKYAGLILNVHPDSCEILEAK